MKIRASIAMALAIASAESIAAPKCGDAKQCAAARLQQALIKQVELRLRDPESARFYGPRLYWNDDSTKLAVCGEINTKNASGGYVGRSGFISVNDGQVIFQASETPELFSAAYGTWCAKLAE